MKPPGTLGLHSSLPRIWPHLLTCFAQRSVEEMALCQSWALRMPGNSHACTLESPELDDRARENSIGKTVKKGKPQDHMKRKLVIPTPSELSPAFQPSLPRCQSVISLGPFSLREAPHCLQPQLSRSWRTTLLSPINPEIQETWLKCLLF